MQVWELSAEALRELRGQVDETGVLPAVLSSGIDPNLADPWKKPRFLGPFAPAGEGSGAMLRLFAVPGDSAARAGIEAWLSRVIGSDTAEALPIPSYVLAREVDRTGRRRHGRDDESWRSYFPVAETAHLAWDPAGGGRLHWTTRAFIDREAFDAWLREVSGATLEGAEGASVRRWTVVEDPYVAPDAREVEAPPEGWGRRRANGTRKLPIFGRSREPQLFSDGALHPHQAPEVLNLSLTAPCQQKCGFCTLFTEVTVSKEADAAALALYRDDLRVAGAAGTRTLRLNGIEPLAASYLFELLALARESGFDFFEVHSTCRPLADPAFAKRFVEALGDRFKIVVPIYGSTAEIHDAIVGSRGAFNDLMRACANLRPLVGGGREVHFQTVAMPQNVADLRAVCRLVDGLGFYSAEYGPRFWSVHFAFPSGSDPRETYGRMVVSMGDLLAALAPPGEPSLHLSIEQGEMLPCVSLAHQNRTGHRVFDLAALAESPGLAGNRYVGSRVAKSTGGGTREHVAVDVAPCPHRAACALGDRCRAEVYALYAERFGFDELRPVGADALAALARRRYDLRLKALRKYHEARRLLAKTRARARAAAALVDELRRAL
jgi:hypothetical protein